MPMQLGESLCFFHYGAEQCDCSVQVGVRWDAAERTAALERKANGRAGEHDECAKRGGESLRSARQADTPGCDSVLEEFFDEVFCLGNVPGEVDSQFGEALDEVAANRKIRMVANGGRRDRSEEPDSASEEIRIACIEGGDGTAGHDWRLDAEHRFLLAREIVEEGAR